MKLREIEDPSPVNKVEPIPEGISFFLFAQVCWQGYWYSIGPVNKNFENIRRTFGTVKYFQLNGFLTFFYQSTMTRLFKSP